MLSSRYIHLHEALGLGPLWLKRGARAQAAAPSAPAADHPPQTASAPKQAAAPTNPVQDMVARLAAEKAIKPAAPETVAAPTPDLAAAHIAVRAVYAVTQGRGEKTLWLSLRPSLNCTAHEMDTGEFGKLLKELIQSSGNSPAQWQSLPEQADTLNAVCIKYLAEEQIQHLVFLGEDIDPALHISRRTPGGVRSLTLPHPARLLRRSALKKTVWEQIAAFFFKEKS